MTEEARKYLFDILKAIELIENFTVGLDNFFIYQNDFKTKSAVERQLGIVGEAVNQFRRIETTIMLSNTHQIIAVRNRLIHSYDSIDDTIVWAIIKKHLPLLKADVLAFL
jgi:uncharacterized protein with HEPN domain